MGFWVIELKKKKKTHQEKKEEQVGLLESSSWLAKHPEKAKFLLPPKVIKHLKVIGFLAFWFTIPAILLLSLVSGPASFLPEIYPTEVQPSLPKPGEVVVIFRIKLKGVEKQGVADQPLFVQFRQKGSGQFITFDPLYVSQDERETEVFKGEVFLPQSKLEKSYTLWLKGPVHLQRKFEGVFLDKNRQLDLTNKPLLPGDLVLPETGPDNQIDAIDRDYLWSLLARKEKGYSQLEIRAADLDLDGQLTGRDASLLIDSGVGSLGER